MSSPDDTENLDDAEDPNLPRLTELVAYLDGELGDAESNRLEQQLASDPPLRSYAETLDRTWQLLSSLEEAPASGEFTRRTLASLQTLPMDDQALRQNSLTQRIRQMARLPFLQIGLWTLAGFLGCSVGLLFSRILRPTQADSADVQILRQLDLLQDYQKIRPVPNAEFLNQAVSMDEGPAEQEIAP